MNDFTASNGVHVRPAPGAEGALSLHDSDVFSFAETIDRVDVVALREFFQAEADERLGRWRDPEDTVFYVYSGGAWDGIFSPIRVVAETNGASWLLDRDDHEPSVPPKVLAVARRFFDAHPEPKPWHDAKPGESWVIDIGTEQYPNPQAVVVSNEGKFLFRDGGSTSVDRAYIRSGRRIYPEVAS